jgi:hypothetical protein
MITMKALDQKRHCVANIVRCFIEWMSREPAGQEIGRLLTEPGGRLTDDIERRMTQRLMSSGSFPSTNPPNSWLF